MRKYLFQNWQALAVVVVSLLGILPTAISQQEASAAGGQHSLSLKIQAVSRTVKVGAPVWVDVTETNNSDMIQLFPKPNATDRGGNVFVTDVWDSKGVHCAESTFYRKFQGHLTPEEMRQEMTSTDPGMYGGNVPLVKPGEAVKYQMNVGRLYDLSHPGTYTIQVRLPAPSNKVTVAVTP